MNLSSKANRKLEILFPLEILMTERHAAQEETLFKYDCKCSHVLFTTTDGRVEVILLLCYFIKSSRTSKLPPAEV